MPPLRDPIAALSDVRRARISHLYPHRSLSHNAEVSTSNIRSGAAFDNLKASWNQVRVVHRPLASFFVAHSLCIACARRAIPADCG